MFELIRLRKKHGDQAIPDLFKANLPTHYCGFPILDESKCPKKCRTCQNICPTGAIEINPLQIDLGKCIFCAECQRSCAHEAIQFSNNHLLGAADRKLLTIATGMTAASYQETAIKARKEIHRLFGRSLKLRQVSAAGCNGCEMELAASNNVNFDMGRFGIDLVASPRHADGIAITGPISKNMAPALHDAYKSVGEPRVVICVGTCAISGGIFSGSSELNRDFFSAIPVDLYIPGCPPHPLTIIRALLKYLGIE